MASKVIQMINLDKHLHVPGWNSIAEVAQELGINPAAVHQRIKRAGIVTWRIGNQLVVKNKDILRLKK